jgi:hypothetical protein
MRIESLPRPVQLLSSALGQPDEINAAFGGCIFRGMNRFSARTDFSVVDGFRDVARARNRQDQ